TTGRSRGVQNPDVVEYNRCGYGVDLRVQRREERREQPEDDGTDDSRGHEPRGQVSDLGPPQVRLVKVTTARPSGRASIAVSDPGSPARRQKLSCGRSSTWASTTRIGLRWQATTTVPPASTASSQAATTRVSSSSRDSSSQS